MLSHHLIWHGRRLLPRPEARLRCLPGRALVPVVRRGTDRPRDRRQAAAHRGPRVRRRLAAAASPLAARWSALAGVRRPRPDRARPRAVQGRRSTPPSCARSRPTPASRTARPAPGGGGLPDVTLPCLGGGPASTSPRLRGPLVLNLWAPGAGRAARRCRRCRSSTTTVRRPGAGARRRLRGPVPRQRAARRPKKRGVTYPLAGRPGRRPAGAPTRSPRSAGCRRSFFVDADGEIAYQRVRWRRLGRRARRPGPRAPRGRPVSPRRPARLAAAGRGGRPLDHRPRPDPVHAARGRATPAGRRRADALRRGPGRARPAAHRARPRHALAPRPGLVPGRLARPGRDRPARPRCARPRRRPGSTRPASRSSPSCPPLWLPPSNFAVTPVLGWWREPSAGHAWSRPTRCTRSTACRSPSCATPTHRITVQRPGAAGAARAS